MRRAACVAASLFSITSCTLGVLDGLAGDPLAGASDSGSDGASDAEPSMDGSRPPADGGVDACGLPGPAGQLLAYYPFDETTGNAVHDCSGNGLDGTFVRQADGGSFTAGKHGGAIRVSEPNGCVDLGMPSALQPSTMTIAVWVEVTSFPSPTASGYVVGQSLNANVSGWRLGALAADGGGTLGWEHTTSGTKYTLDRIWPPDGAWHHLALTFDATSRIEIFFDGASVGLLPSTAPITFLDAPFRVGCRGDDSNYLAGSIDELRIYGRVLTVAEIAGLATP